MKNKLILASNNKHKITEIKNMLGSYEILSLDNIGFFNDIDECSDTCEGNAKIKAQAILEFCERKGLNYPIVADDSGIFVDSLNGEPGVHSARYAGNHDDAANRKKMLLSLQGKTNRDAYYLCVVCLCMNGQFYFFEGKTFGKITDKEIGNNGFGYDSIFFSNDLGKTFGEASNEEKESVSHRGRAFAKLKEFLD